MPRRGHKMHGRLTNQRPLVPPGLRKSPRGVNRMPSPGRTLLLGIVLKVIPGDGIKRFLLIGAGYLLRLASHHLEVAIGDGEIPTGIPVGGGTHEVALLREAETPGVVAGILDDLEVGPIFLEAEDEIGRASCRERV